MQILFILIAGVWGSHSSLDSVESIDEANELNSLVYVFERNLENLRQTVHEELSEDPGLLEIASGAIEELNELFAVAFALLSTSDYAGLAQEVIATLPANPRSVPTIIALGGVFRDYTLTITTLRGIGQVESMPLSSLSRLTNFMNDATRIVTQRLEEGLRRNAAASRTIPEAVHWLQGYPEIMLFLVDGLRVMADSVFMRVLFTQIYFNILNIVQGDADATPRVIAFITNMSRDFGSARTDRSQLVGTLLRIERMGRQNVCIKSICDMMEALYFATVAEFKHSVEVLAFAEDVVQSLDRIDPETCSTAMHELTNSIHVLSADSETTKEHIDEAITRAEQQIDVVRRKSVSVAAIVLLFDSFLHEIFGFEQYF